MATAVSAAKRHPSLMAHWQPGIGRAAAGEGRLRVGHISTELINDSAPGAQCSWPTISRKASACWVDHPDGCRIVAQPSTNSWV